MKKVLLVISTALLLLSCAEKNKDNKISMKEKPAVVTGEKIAWPDGLPVYDHVVIVICENKDYEEVIGSENAPYINSVLKAEGADITQMYGEEHYSEGNYFWLFSGDNHNVGFTDDTPEGVPFSAPNLASQLIASGKTFKGYAENFPKDHLAKYDSTKLYARKHVPWVSFSNVPASSAVSFDEFPKTAAGFEKLPTVSFIIPNLDDDMHNPRDDAGTAVKNGDAWLRANVDTYYQWAKENNSLLILTFDENNDKRGYLGLTNPWIPEVFKTNGDMSAELHRDIVNKTITIFAGANIKHGEYEEEQGVTHVNILRTLESMYGLVKAGAQQPNAAGETFILPEYSVKPGISDDYIITDVFETKN